MNCSPPDRLAGERGDQIGQRPLPLLDRADQLTQCRHLVCLGGK